MRSLEIFDSLGGKVLETRHFYPTLLYFICLLLPILLLYGHGGTFAAEPSQDPETENRYVKFEITNTYGNLDPDDITFDFYQTYIDGSTLKYLEEQTDITPDANGYFYINNVPA